MTRLTFSSPACQWPSSRWGTFSRSHRRGRDSARCTTSRTRGRSVLSWQQLADTNCDKLKTIIVRIQTSEPSKYSNLLNTKQPKSKHLTFQKFFIRFSSGMIMEYQTSANTLTWYPYSSKICRFVIYVTSFSNISYCINCE